MTSVRNARFGDGSCGTHAETIPKDPGIRSRLQLVARDPYSGAVLFRLIPLLRCPDCSMQTLEAGEVMRQNASTLTDGTLTCRSCKCDSSVLGGIWLAMGARKPARTIAQLLNVVPPTPQLYERLWRHRSLSLISRGATSTKTELDELRLALRNENGSAERIVVDVACSEGLYARTLADASTVVIAVDHSLGFLRRVVERSVGLPIVAVRALAQHLPIGSGVVDGVVMGASLNEIGDRTAAAMEMSRVTKPGGRLFSMSLIAAGTRPGRIAQKLAGTGGIDFPTLTETVALFTNAGFVVDTPRVDGVVARLSGHRSG